MAKSKKDRALARDRRRKAREGERTEEAAELAMAYWAGDFWGGHIAQRVHDEGNTVMEIMGKEVDVYVGGGLAVGLWQLFYPMKNPLFRGLITGAAKSAVSVRRGLAGYTDRVAEIALEEAA